MMATDKETTLDGVPVAVAERIASTFVGSGHDLLQLGQTCRFWRQVAQDRRVWQALLQETFGPAAQALGDAGGAGSRHSGIGRDAPVGWAFFPGLDSPGHDCAEPRDTGGHEAGPLQLVAHADRHHQRRTAVAFNSEGWVKDKLLPFHEWGPFTPRPGAGLYVREAYIMRQLPFAAPANVPPPGTPLPQFPGWVFYPAMESPGHDIEAPGTGGTSFAASCATLQELHALAEAQPECIAITLRGQLKRGLKPQTRWIVPPLCDRMQGMWVREGVVVERCLVRPADAGSVQPDPLLRYFQLARRTLYAARDLGMAWLDGSHLARVPDPDLPEGGDSEVVVCNDVWWLHMHGTFRDVRPGRYQVVWRMRLKERHHIVDAQFHANIHATRRLLPASKESVAAELRPEEELPAVRTFTPQRVKMAALRQLSRAAGGRWFEVCPGEVMVPQGVVCDVEAVCINIDSNHKFGVMWDWVKLVDIGNAAGPAGVRSCIIA